MDSDAAADTFGTAPEPPEAVGAMAIPTSAGSGAFWAPLRHAWMTWRATNVLETHVKGALRWDADGHGPFMVVRSDGSTALAFD